MGSGVKIGTREPRVSLWTVPERWGGAFFVLLVAQGASLIGLHTWHTIASAPHARIVDTVIVEILVATPMFVLAGILSMIELEAALTLSVWYENRVRRKEAEWRAELDRQEAEWRAELDRKNAERKTELERKNSKMRAKIRDELREEIWEEAFAEGQRAERERGKGLGAVRERAKRYPYC